MPQERFTSLRDYLEVLESKTLLTKVEGAHWKLEIGALAELAAFSESSAALLFDPVADYPKGYRLAANLYGSERLQAIALGLPEDVSGVERVRFWRKKIQGLKNIPPREVFKGPIQENVFEGSDVDIMQFPIPLWHENDGGRYFGTGDVVITRDPEEGWVNLAVYRCQVHDRETLGLMVVGSHQGRLMAEKYWASGKDAPVVVLGGQDPYVYAGACAPLPWGYSELDYAGGLMGGPVEVIIEPGTGLPIPAHAEIAVIGRVPPPERETRVEGPFGECPGYYTGAAPNTVIHIEKIWHRNNPILQGNPTMRGSATRHALGANLVTSGRIWDSLEPNVPNIRGVYSLYQQCQAGSDILVISLRQSYPGHARHAALAALSTQAAITMNRAVITVDEDIDPSNPQEVLWALVTRCHPDEDIGTISGIPSIGLDPRISPRKRQEGDFTSSTLLIDACVPYSWKDRFPKANVLSPKLKSEVLSKWGEKLGFLSALR